MIKARMEPLNQGSLPPDQERRRSGTRPGAGKPKQGCKDRETTAQHPRRPVPSLPASLLKLDTLAKENTPGAIRGLCHGGSSGTIHSTGKGSRDADIATGAYSNLQQSEPERIRHIPMVKLNGNLHVRKWLYGSNQIEAIKGAQFENRNFGIAVRFHTFTKSHNDRILHTITSRGYLLVSIPVS